jgi:pimeloyl-ACP methyl ester carboxylesterase
MMFHARLVIVTGVGLLLGCTSTPRQLFREGSGRQVVMLGGGTFGAAMFAPHARELSRDYEVIRVQTLNVQAAEAGARMPDNYSVAAESAAVRKSLLRSGIAGPIDIVGSSYGAVVALHLALTFPDYVRTVTLIEPPAFWILPPEEFERDRSLRELRDLIVQMTPNSEPSDQQFFQFRCLLGLCPAAIPAATDAARKEWDLGRKAMRGLAATMTERESESAVRSFSGPVLLLTGSRTVSFHRRIDELLARDLPNVEVAELQGGHNAVQADPNGFLRVLRDFLQRHPVAISSTARARLAR